jgi:deoxycytidylate deaminase
MKFDRLVNLAKNLIIYDDTGIRCRHFAFILHKNRVVSIGRNSKKSHPINRKYGYFEGSGIHAEACAVIKSGKVDHSKNILVTFRIDRNEKVAMGKPCKHCQKLLGDVIFKEIYYSNEKGEFTKFNENLNHRKHKQEKAAVK